MSHDIYAPVGYSYNAADYCLDCIPKVAAKPNTYGLDEHGVRRVMQRNGGSGLRPGHCACAECRLDRMAAARGIDRYDERSFDSGDFPKSIPYHNDIHSECGPATYGEDESDYSIERQYCDANCARCGDVIDGVSKLDGPDVCPAFDHHEWSKA